MESQIVIVTEEFDPHADHIIRLLRQQGHEPIRLHTADIPLQTALSFRFDADGWGGIFDSPRRSIATGAIRSIWWRRPQPFLLPPELTIQEREFARLELRETMRGIWDALDCYWMSRPHHIMLAEAKPGQLQRATNLGLAIPRTLITTEPDQARAFYETCQGRMIYKVLSDPFLAYGLGAETETPEPLPSAEQPAIGAVYTTFIDQTKLALLDSVRIAPCMFQEYVPKRVELRVTIVGDDLFVAEIDSQSNARTQIDWRHYDVAIAYREAKLPPEVAARCHALVRGYGLNYAAIDLIHTPDDRYVFLEINPNGQWLWVQQLVPSLTIAEAIAARLLEGRESTHNACEIRA